MKKKSKINEHIIAAQCVEHAEAMLEKQQNMMKIANDACKLLGIEISGNMTSCDVGQFHLLECPIYQSAINFDENIEKALNGECAKSNRKREFYDNDVIKQLEKKISCPICRNIMTKMKADK